MDIEELKITTIAESMKYMEKVYGIDKDKAENLIRKVNLEKYIQEYPDVYAHYSIEQIIDLIMW